MKLCLAGAVGASFAGSAAAQACCAGLNGYGLYPYNPVCAEACIRSFSGLMLNCSDPMPESGGMDHMMSMTTPDCWAKDDAYLTSVAWCMYTKCAQQGVPASDLEKLWAQEVAGFPPNNAAPKWTYGMALSRVNPQPPGREVQDKDKDLNATSIVNALTYRRQWNTLGAVLNEGVLESTYGIALSIVALCLPILLTWLGYLPGLSGLFRYLKPYIIYPSLIGTYSVRPLPWLLGNSPTVGQSIYLTILIGLTVIFTAIGIEPRTPSAWFSGSWQEIIAYLLYRTGAMGFVLLPILLLFSSRNNVLLWLTNWSHSTYMLLHRWVGRLFMLEAVLHSIFGLLAYRKDEGTAWWKWGAVATIFSVLLCFGSVLPIRKLQYELFLISHIILAVFTIVGCWYHLVIWYSAMGMSYPTYTGGYETWLYFACAVWFFDRLVRVVRIVKVGARRSKITDLGGGYLRVDVPGVRWGSEAGKHVYAYFPTLNPLRPWENHPFSVIPTPLLHVPGAGASDAEGASNRSGHKGTEGLKEHMVENQVVARPSIDNTAVGVTLFVRKSTGMTSHLKAHDSLLTLLDGPYPNNQTKEVLRCDRLLLIGGGIGITSLLPWSHQHWNVKLAWGVKETASCLVDEMSASFSRIVPADRDIRIGSRLDVEQLLAEEEAAGWKRVGVVVSGPGPMCDDVRAAVAAAGRRGLTHFELEVDAYSW